ncbi:hypothetical protein D8674_019987 [Pyrus ussuriensis x Pyrus communis]|uniref:Uncharacterized protein n=1 Tax=Pyrus ussuriensis x Pyrus communis TaxID=2448454 RepID=A0A5N5G931_9ROSA|nr:hypothetical protein D8674_019987 [Pyrus ussuriensis x Pyrus communis]
MGDKDNTVSIEIGKDSFPPSLRERKPDQERLESSEFGLVRFEKGGWEGEGEDEAGIVSNHRSSASIRHEEAGW